MFFMKTHCNYDDNEEVINKKNANDEPLTKSV